MSDVYHNLCRICQATTTLCSKHCCKQQYLLKENHIDNLTPIHSPKHGTYFLEDDVIQKAIQIHGSLDKLHIKLQKRQQSCTQKQKDRQTKKQLREIKLRQILSDYKLEYKSTGNCYSYVHYGKPSLWEVIELESQKVETQVKRQFNLIKELQQHSLPPNTNHPVAQEYIQGNTKRDLHATVRKLEMDHFVNTKFYQKNNHPMFTVAFE